MKTGFYNISRLSTNQLRDFFRDAVMLSYNTHVEEMVGWTRESTTKITIGDMIDEAHQSYHNVCIDRSMQHDHEKYGEIGYTIIGDKYFLYIYVTLDNLQELVKRYKLIME